MKVKRVLLVSLSFFFFFAFFIKKADAQAINYQTFKYGTHQTSMADGYYAKPAQIKAEGHRYLITMTIRTKKSLSPYPVTVLSVNNQAPFNIVKSRNGASYDYRYSFYTSDPRKEISSKIKIDVPNVYQATHQISFKFDAQNLPKLNTNSKNKQAASSKKEAISADPSALIGQAKKQSDLAKKKEAKLARQQLAQNQRNIAANQQNQKMFYYTILGGIISTLILVVAASFFVLSVKNRKKK